MSGNKVEHELPHGWCWAAVGDTGNYINGFAFKPEHRESAGRPIVRIQNLTAPEKALNRTSLAVSEDFHVATGEMLLSWSATVDVFVWNREPALVNQHIFKVVPDERVVDKAFLFYWLKVAIDQLLDSEHLHGSTMKHINRGPFVAHRIPLPPLHEQQRIAEALEELLSDLDAGIAELKAAQRKLAHYRQSLLKAAVEGALTADWREQRKAVHGSSSPRKRGSMDVYPGTAKSMDSRLRGNDDVEETGADLLQRILRERRARWERKHGGKKKYAEPVTPDTANLPALPEGWVWASLDMLGEIASGVAKGTKRTSDVPTREVAYLRVANVQRGYLNLTEVKNIEATEADIAELRLQPGDVLFNEGGDLDKLGRGWVWYGEVAECIHQNHVFRMRPILSATPSEFISHHGNSFGKEWFKKAGKQTTNLASINMTMLRAFPVPVPPEAESREIIDQLTLALDNVAAQQTAIEHALKQSTAQRKNLLKAAFAGQLVPQDPNDEPASELLARIRAARESLSAAGKRKKAKSKQ